MKVILRGQIVNVFEKERTDNGAIKVNFTVADRIRRVKGQDGPFIRCTAYGNNAKKILDEFNQRDSEDKLISRKILIYGDESFYMKETDVVITEKLPAKDLFTLFGYSEEDLEEEDRGKSVVIKLNKNIEVLTPCITVSDIEYDDDLAPNKYKKKDKKSKASIGITLSNDMQEEETDEISGFDYKTRSKKLEELMSED